MPMVRSALIVIAALAGSTAYGQASDQAVIPPAESILGLSQAEWSVKWWQWAFSFPRTSSPVSDKTGEQCGEKQPDGLWFLAGTYGTARAIRTCKVPSGRILFFPLVNYVVYPRQGTSVSCFALASEAARLTDDPDILILQLDGRRIDLPLSHRQVPSTCFDIGAGREPPAPLAPTAANGYYVALRPMSPGTHTLDFGAILPSLQQAVTYTLIVE